MRQLIRLRTTQRQINSRC